MNKLFAMLILVVLMGGTIGAMPMMDMQMPAQQMPEMEMKVMDMMPWQMTDMDVMFPKFATHKAFTSVPTPPDMDMMPWQMPMSVMMANHGKEPKVQMMPWQMADMDIMSPKVATNGVDPIGKMMSMQNMDINGAIASNLFG